MALIRIQRDPARITNCEEYRHNGNLLDWLADNEPAAFDGLHCLITLNGIAIADTTKAGSADDLDSAIDIQIGEFDTVCIMIRPAGFDPFTWVLIAAVVVGSYVLARALLPTIKTPTSDGGAASNNQLNASSNSFRPNQAIPDIAGQVVSYPDFIQPSYYTYNASGRRVFREILCIGVGYYEIEPWKIGDTPLTDVPGSSVEIFEPGETPAGLINVRNAEAAENSELPPPGATTRTVVTNSGLISATRFMIGADAMGELRPIVGVVIDVQIDVLLNDDTYDNVSGPFTVTAVGGGYFDVSSTGTGGGQIIGGYMTNTDYEPSSTWFTLPGDEVTEVRAHIIMPTGIRTGDGEAASVSASMQVERLVAGVPSGVIYERACSFNGNTQQAQAATFVVGPEFGLTEPGEFRCKITRVTSSLGDNALDLMKLERLESVTPYTADFGFVTIADVNRVTQQNGGLAGSSNKVNALVTRKLRIYDNDTGVYGATYTATRNYSDYVFYLLYERMGVSIEYIDTDALFGIQESLLDPQLGYFDFTFDNRDASARDRVNAACNCARVIPWNDGLIWTFVRDERKYVKTTMFNRRNLKSASHRYVQTFRRPADYDSVIIKYVDPDKNASAQIKRKIDQATGSILPGSGVRPLEIDLTGCRNLLQATNRADLEVRRLVYQSVTVTDTALDDALYVQKGARVDWVDMYDGDLFSGEIIGVDGSVYSTSERFTPQVGVQYWVYVTDEDGNTSNSVRAYARGDGNIFGFTAVGLTGVYLPTGKQQLGSRYVIASNNDFDASTFIFDGRSRPNELRECEITLIEYNDSMYEMDGGEPPSSGFYVEPGYVLPGYVEVR